MSTEKPEHCGQQMADVQVADVHAAVCISRVRADSHSSLLALPWRRRRRPRAQQPTTVDTVPLPLTAGEADGERPRRNLFPKTDWDWGFTTFHFGLGSGFDIAWFAQDDDSKEQVTMDPGFKWRDFRFIANGRFKLEATNHVADRNHVGRSHRRLVCSPDGNHGGSTGDLGETSSSAAPRRASASPR